MGHSKDEGCYVVCWSLFAFLLLTLFDDIMIYGPLHRAASCWAGFFYFLYIFFPMSMTMDLKTGYDKCFIFPQNQIQIMKPCLLLIGLVSHAYTAAFTYNSCTSTQIFNVATFQCEECPTNMIPNPNQNIATSCICQEGYYPDIDHVCTSFGLTCTTNQYIPAFLRDGSQAADFSAITCQDCDSKAYKDENGTGCIPCPRKMVYQVGEGCVCEDQTLISSQLGCFEESLTDGLGNLGQSSSSYYDELKYVKMSIKQLLPGCYYYKDLLSCSYLVNLCTYSLGDADTAECKFFDRVSEASQYLEYSSSDSYNMPPGSFNKDSTINFKLISFLPTGNYVKEQTMKLADIVRCGMPSNNSVFVYVGNNMQFECQFDFDYLLERINTNTYQNYLYELFIQGTDDKFYQVAVQLDGRSTSTKRFFLEDTFTSDSSINVLKSMSFELQMNSTGYLVNPKLSVSYEKLSVQDGKVTPSSSSTQTISYKVSFTYDLTNFWTAFTVIIIIVSILALLQAIARTYIGYLNRESFFSFFFYLPKFWSLWMFYFLFCISGYWFLFSKTTQDLYIFVPGSSDSFYIAFYVLAGAMGFFRLLTVIIEKNDKLNIEVFMINWEKGQFKNSWREIFIINSLAQFYTHRTVSVFWMLFVVMFFLVGFDWSDHAAEVTHTDLSNIYYFNPINRMFLYFLASAIFIVVGIIFKILRRISVIQWPYPFQDFVDYCNVTNISFFFMKKRSAQANYIHASIADRTEVTYKQINEAIRRGLNKNRAITNEVAFQDHQRMYTVYLCKDLEDKFMNMLKKLDDEEHEKASKITHKNKQKSKRESHPREEFVEKKLKPYLQVISREGSNRTKSITESLFGMPPVNLRDANALRNRNEVFFDDKMDLVTDVFPNGNQFEELHTVIIIFLMFILMTSSISVSAFLTYFVDEYLMNGWVANSCRSQLQKMTRVKEGFML